uniref:Uncharacterized protein n=1 Tax=Arundo donax TaxID=35708 RepID=A0A0A9A822_ARUDO
MNPYLLAAAESPKQCVVISAAEPKQRSQGGCEGWR